MATGQTVSLPEKATWRLRDALSRPRVSSLSREVRESRLTYLNWLKLRNLERALDAASRVEGDFLEAGVALGGSAIIIRRLMPRDRVLHLYDTFGMIPPTNERDDEKSHRRYEEIASGQSKGLGEDPYYGYVENLHDQVIANLERFDAGEGVRTHEGLFEDTLRPDCPVAFAHLDCDWYDSTRLALERIYPHLPAGGVVVIDDFGDYGGARAAVESFTAEHPELRPWLRGYSLVLRRAR